MFNSLKNLIMPKKATTKKVATKKEPVVWEVPRFELPTYRERLEEMIRDVPENEPRKEIIAKELVWVLSKLK